jgi:lysyl-tRNA synthetase class 2
MHVESTAISEIDYDRRDHTLRVRFASGERYAYADVAPAVHRAFVEAESKGRFFQAHIRDRYPYQKLN